MKRVLTLLTAMVFVLGVGRLADAYLISFLYEDSFTGVNDSSGLSTTDATDTDVGTHLDLLGGTADVYGYYADGVQAPATLSHRGTRGLGVNRNEVDEVDRVANVDQWEQIWITFDTPYYIDYVEVRSLFYEDTASNMEWAAIDFMYGGSVVGTEYLSGDENLSGGGVGDNWWQGSAYAVNKLVFYVPTVDDQDNPINVNLSEFAVARIDGTPVPEPGTLLLLGSGLAGLGGFARLKLRRRRRS